MPAVSQAGLFTLQIVANNGDLAVSHRLYTYAPATTTKKTVYTEPTGTTSHTYVSDGIGGEYIALDARGELPAPLYLTAGGYDICLKTAAGATVWTRRASASALDSAEDLVGAVGAGLIGFDYTEDYPPDTVGARLKYIGVSPEDFGAVGDGVTDDTVALQAALDIGGVIRATPGASYKVTAAVYLSQDNTTFYGYGAKIVHDTATISSALRADNVDNCAIFGIEVDGKKSLKSASGTASAYGIASSGATNLRIEHCYVHDCYEHGIRFGSGCENVTVVNNRTEDNGNVANQRGYGVWGFDGIQGCIISNNTCLNDEAGGISVDEASTGAPGDPVDNVIMNSNRCSGTGDIYIAMRYEGSQNGTISGNHLNATSHDGLVVRSIQDDRITGFLTVTGNYITGGRSAVTITDPTNVIFSGNFVRLVAHADNVAAIDVYANNGAPSHSMSIVGNQVLSAMAGISIGTNAGHSTDLNMVVIQSNLVEYDGATPADAGSDGISIIGSQFATVGNNTIKAFSDGIVSGLMPVNSTILIENNSCFANERYGIQLTGDRQKIVRANTTDGNATAGLRLESTTDSVNTYLLDNVCLDGLSSAAGIDSTRRRDNWGFGSTTEATAANIASAAHAINTSGKNTGAFVWDTTNNRLMIARGASDTSPWSVCDGSASVTPS
jgi:hypothetical protein